MLEKVKWEKFKLGDLFDIENWEYGKNKKYMTILSKPTNKSISVISGITENNGINFYTEDTVEKNEIFENELTISTRGEYSGTVFYHNKKFVLANNILVMKMPNLFKNQKLFIGSLINSFPYGGYNNYPKKSTLQEDFIELPIKNDGSIDFDFMMNFVSELEICQVSDLKAYLVTTGLSDYVLTSEEEKILEIFRENEVKWKKFKIGDLFEINSYKKRFDANKVNILEEGHPYVVGTALNNGIRGYLKEDEEFLNEGNTISFGQDTATMFYQEKPYFTGDKIKIIKSKYKEFNKLNSHFFVSAMSKSFSTFAWGSSSFSINIIENQEIYLPIKNNEINFEFMETLISAIQKEIIKDVVLYTDKKIKATKKVVSNK